MTRITSLCPAVPSCQKKVGSLTSNLKALRLDILNHLNGSLLDVCHVLAVAMLPQETRCADDDVQSVHASLHRQFGIAHVATDICRMLITDRSVPKPEGVKAHVSGSWPRRRISFERAMYAVEAPVPSSRACRLPRNPCVTALTRLETSIQCNRHQKRPALPSGEHGVSDDRIERGGGVVSAIPLALDNEMRC